MTEIYKKLPLDIKYQIDLIILNEYKLFISNIKRKRSLIYDCFICQSYYADNTEEIVWDIRNRKKDLYRGHYDYTTTLYINICNKCKFIYTINKWTCGWDEWDALDNIYYYKS